jgi:iron complex outermembrane receptor protein
VQPNARLAWIPTDRQTLWWAVSRAVQVPGRLVNDTTFTPFGVFPVSMIPIGPPLGEVPLFVSNDATRGHQLDSQEVIAYEFGYRLQPVERLALDAAVFYNRYDGFFAGTPDPPALRLAPIPHLFVAFPVGETQGTGESHGVEVSAQWQALEKWRLAGSYSYLQISLDEVARVSIFSEGKDPVHQFSLRSALDLPGNLEFDVWGRFVDRLPAVGLKQYFDLDVRLSWKPVKNLEIALVGQNLVEPDRFEFGQGALIKTQNTPTPRGGYVQVSYKF